MTVHRAVSVVKPHLVGRILTPGRVIAVNVLVVVLMVGFYVLPAHHARVLTVPAISPSPLCFLTSTPATKELFQIFPYIDIVLMSLLPFLLISISNVVLVYHVWLATRRARHMVDSWSFAARAQALARSKATLSLTLTAIVVSLTFVVLTLPSIVYVAMKISAATGPSSPIAEEKFIQTFFSAISDVMLECSFAVNFYLYCLTGRRFRNEFLKVMRCGQHGNPPRVGAQGQGRQVKDTSTASHFAVPEVLAPVREQPSRPVLY
jgi:hypothetical protein